MSQNDQTQIDAEIIKNVMDCAESILSKKGENLKILDLAKESHFTQYFVIASAMSDRQATAIAETVYKDMKDKHGLVPGALEGLSEGRWILMDYGSFVVHVFQDSLREYYDLEGLWSHAKRVTVPESLYRSPALAQ
jgi:ribosome silencing factor RsfS/YbeB/iojap